VRSVRGVRRENAEWYTVTCNQLDKAKIFLAEQFPLEAEVATLRQREGSGLAALRGKPGRRGGGEATTGKRGKDEEVGR